MINFLKNFLTGEKSPEEQALISAQHRRDVMMVVSDNDDEDEDEDESCNDRPAQGGCCGGGCG
jgi:hypothetical protein